MYPPSQAAYDRAITVFSPDGRLFQVEYAREAVKTGATSIGIVCKDGIALMAHKRVSSPLLIGGSTEKIFSIDQHIAAASSGLVADARKLVDFSRVEAQKHRLTFDEEIPVELLAKNIGDHIQFYTQYAGVRPYGVSFLIAGVDGGLRLFETDPSGALFEFKATAIGSGKKAVEEILEKEYRDDMPLSDGVKLGMKALKKVVEEKLTPAMVDLALVKADDHKVHKVGKDQKAQWMS